MITRSLLERYVKPFGSVPVCMFGFVTTTVTVPAPCALVVAVIVVPFKTTTAVAAAPPSVMVAPARKLVPVIVTLVPPDVGPDAAEIAVTVGAVPAGSGVQEETPAFVPA